MAERLPVWVRARAWASRLLAPNLARCYRCQTSFWGPIRVAHHSTSYSGPGRACFPLCERCWQQLAPAERLPFYEDLVDVWVAGSLATDQLELENARRQIRWAVTNGG